MTVGQKFIRSLNQTVTIILSAFAGGFAGNFLASNPGFFEQSGATIGLLVLLLPTVLLINLISGYQNEEADAETQKVIIKGGGEKIKIMRGNEDLVEFSLDNVASVEGNLSMAESERPIEETEYI